MKFKHGMAEVTLGVSRKCANANQYTASSPLIVSPNSVATFLRFSRFIRPAYEADRGNREIWCLVFSPSVGLYTPGHQKDNALGNKLSKTVDCGRRRCAPGGEEISVPSPPPGD